MESQSELKKLLDPIPIGLFFKENYEKQYLFLKGKEANRYDAVLTIRDIENVLGQNILKAQNLTIVNKAILDLGAWTDLLKTGNLSVNRDKVVESFLDGNSIVLNGLNRYVPKLDKFTSKLSQALRSRVVANIYITPPSSQAFPPHFDFHDVFVLQIFGSKKWNLYDNPVVLPDSNHHLKDNLNTKDLEPSNTLILKRGDLMYLPRGLRHDAVSLSEHSIHVTLGIYPVKYYEIISNQLEHSTFDGWLRNSFPFWKNDIDRIENLKLIKENLLEWVNDLDPEKLDVLGQNMGIKNIPTDFSNRFLDIIEAKPIAEDDIIATRNLNNKTPQVKGSLVVYKSTNGKEFSYPLLFKEDISKILETEHIRVSKIDCSLDVDNKLKLIQKLFNDGLIKRIAPEKD